VGIEGKHPKNGTHSSQILPPLQLAPDGHTLLQPPQLDGSELVSVQTLPQTVLPAGHAHAPDTHVSPAMQALPQLPQLSGSELVFAQISPHI
jgi:hypothetical protein